MPQFQDYWKGTLMAKLPSQTLTSLADGVVRHLAFHTEYLEPPRAYQFSLPDNRYLLLHDFLEKDKRFLLCLAPRPISRILGADPPGLYIHVIISRPRKLSQEGPWNVGLSNRQARRFHSYVRHAIDQSWRNRHERRDASLVVLDPLAAPVALTDTKLPD